MALASVWAARAYAAVTVDGPPSVNTGVMQTHEWTHTVVAGGKSRYALVGASVGQDQQARIMSVSFGGKAMTFLGESVNADEVRVELWGLPNPPEGEQPVSLRLTESEGVVAGAISLAGVAEVGDVVTARGTGGKAAVTVPSETGGLVIDLFGAAAGDAPEASDGNTRAWSRVARVVAAAGTSPGAASVRTGWQASNNQKWALAALSVRPAASPASADAGAAKPDAAGPLDARPGAANPDGAGSIDARTGAANADGAVRAVSLAVNAGCAFAPPSAPPAPVWAVLALCLLRRRR